MEILAIYDMYHIEIIYNMYIYTCVCVYVDVVVDASGVTKWMYYVFDLIYYNGRTGWYPSFSYRQHLVRYDLSGQWYDIWGIGRHAVEMYNRLQ